MRRCASPRKCPPRLAGSKSAPSGPLADWQACVMDPAVAAAVAEAHRRHWGFVLAATARVTRDLDVAEDCVQDAYVAALDAWAKQGVPRNPGAWLTTAARH